MKNIAQYSSYRKFLLDSFQAEKKATIGVTLATYGKAFGMAASTLKMILSGKRNLTVSNIHKIARAFKMSPMEHDFFEALVLLEQAESSEEKAFYKARSVGLRKEFKLAPMRTSDRRFISSWMAPALLVYLKDIAGLNNIDEVKIAKKLNVPVEEVQKVLMALNEAGIISSNVSETHVIFDKLTNRTGERDYIKSEALEVARRIEKDFSNPDTLFRAFTITVDRGDLPSLRAELIALLETYMAKPASPGGDRLVEKIFVASYPVFPLT
jgi:uncharacterized protein (TIGR02147 family)